ncbi:LacI family DNA-binding transcriptional regulator [Tropicimonas sediminicola]|uniref:Transcriptional regulator, LacI family n=1 Tax=Tropicimonas sediminicola TaxID=1031541 RepID=A0A239LEN0_9RHOB|nr:LacI family DNA-binding transcriptional regulator [Tropicimonas sediminicola]SNT28392.1 transcriptional regulator, LacI family [Tropicimonas sediminicola]
MATIRDVAKAAGVSVSTVSLALNQKERVSSKTFRKIMDAAEATGYVANPIAKSLRKGRSPFVSLIVSDIRTYFAQMFLAEFEHRAFEKGYLLTLSDKSGVASDEAAVIRQLIAQRVAGVMISPTQQTADLLPRLDAAGIPVVLFDHQVPGTPYDFVGLDNRLAVSMLVRHLFGLGHRRIAFIGGETGHWSAVEREIGFRTTMETHGLEIEADTVLSGDYTRASGYQAATRLLCAPRPVTAIVAANNEMMVGTLQAAQEFGFRCPEDLSACCIDEAPWGDVLRPRVTHAAQPARDMAVQACTWLMERLEDPNADIAPRSRAFEPRFVSGETTDRPAERA